MQCHILKYDIYRSYVQDTFELDDDFDVYVSFIPNKTAYIIY